MIEWLLAPLHYQFMIRGLLAAITVGIVCGVLGTYVVLRSMAFFGDALAHAILPGVAVAYLVGGGAQGSLFIGALAAGIATALGIGAISKSGQVREDTAIGVLFAAMFALGVALISTVRNFSVDLTHFMFGNVLGVSPADLRLTAIFGGLVVLLVFAFYKEFLVISFDPVLASILRLPAQFFRYLLLVMLAVTIVIALQTVGVGLMVAMLITPAAAASLLTRRLPVMMMAAASIGALSGVIGLYLSYYVSVASGAAIVLVCTAFFLLALFFAPTRGAAWRFRAQSWVVALTKRWLVRAYRSPGLFRCLDKTISHDYHISHDYNSHPEEHDHHTGRGGAALWHQAGVLPGLAAGGRQRRDPRPGHPRPGRISAAAVGRGAALLARARRRGGVGCGTRCGRLNPCATCWILSSACPLSPWKSVAMWSRCCSSPTKRN